jgi:hypothetical protein
VDKYGKHVVGDNFTFWIIDNVRYICKEATAEGYYFVRILKQFT